MSLPEHRPDLLSRSLSDQTAPVQLTELAAGAAAQLHATSLGDDDFALLEALGMTRSCRFRVCKVGDPWIVQIRETRIGLAASVARRIFVVPDAAC
jgi:Fe2+ transport system protein FeoA